jgi:protein TonB
MSKLANSLLVALLAQFLGTAAAQQPASPVKVLPPPHKHTGQGVLRANSCPPISYPEKSLQEKVVGVGRARVETTPDGKYSSSYISVSSGSEELDKAALAALPRCQYTPSFREGVGIRDTLIIEFVWALEPKPGVAFDSK